MLQSCGIAIDHPELPKIDFVYSDVRKMPEQTSCLPRIDSNFAGTWQDTGYMQKERDDLIYCPARDVRSTYVNTRDMLRSFVHDRRDARKVGAAERIVVHPKNIVLGDTVRYSPYVRGWNVMSPRGLQMRAPEAKRKSVCSGNTVSPVRHVTNRVEQQPSPRRSEQGTGPHQLLQKYKNIDWKRVYMIAKMLLKSRHGSNSQISRHEMLIALCFVIRKMYSNKDLPCSTHENQSPRCSSQSIGPQYLMRAAKTVEQPKIEVQQAVTSDRKNWELKLSRECVSNNVVNVARDSEEGVSWQRVAGQWFKDGVHSIKSEICCPEGSYNDIDRLNGTTPTRKVQPVTEGVKTEHSDGSISLFETLSAMYKLPGDETKGSGPKWRGSEIDNASGMGELGSSIQFDGTGIKNEPNEKYASYCMEQQNGSDVPDFSHLIQGHAYQEDGSLVGNAVVKLEDLDLATVEVSDEMYNIFDVLGKDN